MSSAHALDWPLVVAPATWRCVDFISDLHLQASEPATFDAWQRYMSGTQAQAVFLLGDLFEAWVGDDILDEPAAATPDGGNWGNFEQRCARILLDASTRMALFFMRGNRDFLAGKAFARACGMRLLEDPAVLDFAGERWLLSHGDALCLADTDYLKFRALVRGEAWQSDFLGRPLAERQAMARGLRARSEQHKRTHPVPVDVDTPAARAWLAQAGATRFLHGHTHQPADHDMGDGLQRIVLSDWDLGAHPARAQVLRIDADAGMGCRVRRLPLDAVA